MWKTDEELLSFISLELLYTVNDSEYVLKDTLNNKTFKVTENRYQELIREGESAYNSIWESEDDQNDTDLDYIVQYIGKGDFNEC